MIQTVTVNSALSPNWVGCTVSTPKEPRLRAHCAQAARTALCRGPPPAVSQVPPTMSSRRVTRALVVSRAHATVSQRCCLLYRDSKGRPPVTIQKLYHDPEPMSRALLPCRECSGPYRGAVLRALLPCHKVLLPPPVTIQNFVSRHTAVARPCGRELPLAPRASRPCCGPLLAVSLGRVTRLLAVSWPPFTRPWAPVPFLVTLQYVVS